MAFKWVSKVKSLLPGGSPTEQDISELTVAVAEDSPKKKQTTVKEPDTEPSTTVPWYRFMIDQIPLMMLLTGLLMSACAQLIGPWGFLGFLFLASAPIVYWLRRIERRMIESLEYQKQRDAHRR